MYMFLNLVLQVLCSLHPPINTPKTITMLFSILMSATFTSIKYLKLEKKITFFYMSASPFHSNVVEYLACGKCLYIFVI